MLSWGNISAAGGTTFRLRLDLPVAVGTFHRFPCGRAKRFSTGYELPGAARHHGRPPRGLFQRPSRRWPQWGGLIGGGLGAFRPAMELRPALRVARGDPRPDTPALGWCRWVG